MNEVLLNFILQWFGVIFFVLLVLIWTAGIYVWRLHFCDREEAEEEE